ncbi:ABC transporter-associated protein EcsC [Clostridium polyendosporum]|uniref:ABC transporter-associated protein EcsC n=1 Tax=Clostridium polyendosporum TaxID=69208 RepID=A0A919RWJ3_9CLOT|nr:EcsC family protein [Clostridium polyendosporum]GIM27624.1 ABC transporter-associated protein EcsC [Clostridium polyendosporum]
MKSYEEKALYELKIWQKKMAKKPSFTSGITKGLQNKVNNLIPEKVHTVVTETIKNMVKGVLIGSEFMTKRILVQAPLEERERLVMDKLDFYKKAAVLSGAGTGGAGFFIGLADFPILISLKIKFLFDVASLYGFDVRNYKERLYILYIFQLAFASDKRRNEVYKEILDWDNYVQKLPDDINSFDWRTFQQEYRDYIDLAKMLQLVPGIGAVIGAYANYKLMNKLGEIAINAYRLRLFNIKTL